MILLLKHVIALLYLLTGSINDFKTREVSDFANYGLIAFGFIVNILASFIYSDYTFILYSGIGFGIFFLISIIMFYSGQWGGGDSKLLMGLGALYGLEISFILSEFFNQFIFHFLINTLIMGAVYGIIYTIFLAIINFKKFSHEYKNRISKLKYIRFSLLILLIITAILTAVYRETSILLLLAVIVSVAATFYLWITIRSVEKGILHKWYKVNKLTEGDWIATDLIYNKREFLKKKVINDTDLIKIKKHFDKYNPIVKVKGVLGYKKKIRISDIKKGDYILSKNSIVKNKKIDENDIVKFQYYSCKFKLLDVKIQRKGIFGTRNLNISPTELKRSDILIEKLNLGFYIAGPKDLGIKKEQIALLKKYFDKERILVKEGIPFVPSFLLGWIVTIFWGNIILLIL